MKSLLSSPNESLMQAIGSFSWRIGATPHQRCVPVGTRRPVTSPAAAARCESRGDRMMFVFGLGFVGRYVSVWLKKEGWDVAGTCTSAIRKRELEEMDLDAFIFYAHKSKLESLPALQNATHVLISIPPVAGFGDPLLSLHKDLQTLLSFGNLKWLGYLSTTSVYGDCNGALVSEDYPVNPITESAKSRVVAEKGWLDLGHELGVPVYIFRLGGIYGPGRSALDTIVKQKSMSEKQTMRKSKLYTARVHVADIFQAIKASFDVSFSGWYIFGEPHLELAEQNSHEPSKHGKHGKHFLHAPSTQECTYKERKKEREIYNVVDDDPAPRAEVFAFAQALIQSKWPDVVSRFGDAVDLQRQDLKMEIVGGEKRVSNARLKEQLGVKLLYPTYKSGLQSILDYYLVGNGGNHLIK